MPGPLGHNYPNLPRLNAECITERDLTLPENFSEIVLPNQEIWTSVKDDEESIISEAFSNIGNIANTEEVKDFLKNFALHAILVFFKNNGHPTLPLDFRTLLQTHTFRETKWLPNFLTFTCGWS